jgi:hypothetical protein
MVSDLKYSISSGDGAKQAFLNLLEQEAAWQDNYQIQGFFAPYKRYKIVSLDEFPSKEEAVSFINSNRPFKLRPKTLGCVFIKNDTNTKYLFFIQ